MSREITAEPGLVAFCGLYCGACRRYLREKCPGCHENERAKWCKVRVCWLENNYLSCADCTEFDDPRDCRKFHNFFSRTIGFILRSDRPACITRIKETGLEEYARQMASERRQTIKR